MERSAVGRKRVRRALWKAVGALALAAPLSAQTVFLPPRASVTGPSGFSTLYASRGEGQLFFGARITYDRRGLDVAIAPGPHPGFDAGAVDRTVAIIVARYRFRRPPAARGKRVQSDSDRAAESPAPR